ncbi:MAG: PAS domain S-box protein [Deltaproteobacteria bacterium]|nr:PAS domain S-box protein [Deltaproteobacteria bacterium]
MYNDLDKKSALQEQVIPADLYRTLFEKTSDAVFIVEPATSSLVGVNEQACSLLGYSRAEMRSLSVRDISTDFQDTATWHTHTARVRQLGQMVGIFNGRHKNGTIIQAEVIIKIIRHNNREYLFAAVRNLSKQKQTEQILRNNKAELSQQKLQLEDANAALRILLKHQDEAQSSVEAKVLANVKTLILPFIEKLQQSQLNSRQQALLEIITSNMDEIIAPFTKQLTTEFTLFTPREIQIANLIKEGKTTKEIADLLQITPRVIDFHRNHIRSKLGLKHKKKSLKTHLQTMM